MPPAAVGAVFVSIGASAAAGAAITAIATSVYVGAAIGAVVGAVGAAITGGDILQGALKGAVIGGVTKGIGTGIGLAAEGATAVEGVGSAAVGNAGLETAGAELGHIANAGGSATQAGAVAPAVAAAPTVGPPPVTPPPEGGIISGVGNWINNNPTQAMMLGQTIGGAAKGMSDNRAANKELEAAMERDRLNIQSTKVSGLNMMDLKIALPSVGTFTDAPKWQMPTGGLIKEAQNATA